MGYRSDVRIVTSKRGFERLKEFSHNYLENLGGDEVKYDLMEQIEVIKQNAFEVYFGWNYLKWYDNFNNIKAIEKGLEWLRLHDYSYRFARLGENYDDYEERSWDNENENEQDLDYPNIERYFDDEVV